MRTILLILACATFFCCRLQAQNRLQGWVYSAERQPLAEALVTAMQPGDTRQVLSSTRTDSAGVFTLTGLPEDILLEVAAFGYEGHIRQVRTADYRDKPLEVSLTYITLGEVTVTATGQPRMVREGNKVIIDQLDNSPHAKGNDMYAFMRYIPMLKVPVLDGDITVRESMNAPTVLLVNGKHINIPMDAYLKTLRVEQIERIEVVAYPVGEYKVRPGYSVINLIVKKRPDEGLQYNLHLMDIQHSRNNQDVSFSLNYTKNKAYITSGVFLRNANDKKETAYNYLYHNTGRQILEEHSAKDHYLIGSAYFNFGYELNKRHTIGVQAGIGVNDADCSNDVVTEYKMQDDIRIDSTSTTQNESYNPRKFSDVNANLNYTFKTDEKGSVFYADIDYRMHRPKNVMRSNYRSWQDISGSADGRNILQKSQTSVDAIGVWLRYIHSFQSGSRLVSGISYYTAYSRNDYSYGHSESGEEANGAGQSSRFKYRDHSFTAYANLDHKFSEKVDFSIGANLEGYKANGTQAETGPKMDRGDFNVTPNLSVRYTPNDNHYLSFRATYTAYQPNYNDMNPFKTYISPTTYHAGNLDLKTSKNFYASLMYDLFGDYTFYVSTSYAKNAGNYFIQADENGQVAMLPNQRDFFNFGISFSYAKSLFKDYLNFNVGVGYDFYKMMSNGGAFITQKNNEYYAEVDGDITLSRKKRMSLAVNYSFMSESDGVAYSCPSEHSLSLRFQKRFDYSNFSIGISRRLQKNDTRYFHQNDFSYLSKQKRYWLIMASYSITFGNKRTRSVSGRDNNQLKSRMAQPANK